MRRRQWCSVPAPLLTRPGTGAQVASQQCPILPAGWDALNLCLRRLSSASAGGVEGFAADEDGAGNGQGLSHSGADADLAVVAFGKAFDDVAVESLVAGEQVAGCHVLFAAEFGTAAPAHVGVLMHALARVVRDGRQAYAGDNFPSAALAHVAKE